MSTPHTGAEFRPDEAFVGATERFLELLRTFGVAGAGRAPDWSAMAAPLASQFEQWLRLSQSATPWFSNAAAPWGAGAFAKGAAAPPGPGPAMPPWWFGALPLGPAAPQATEAQRVFELLGRLAQLQGQLASYWSEIANTAAQRFVARLGSSAAPPATLDQALKLYEQWVSCAEEAYAATVHKEDFARLQAEIANTSAALLLEQRRHADALVRAFGLPTRNEIDRLHEELQELRRQLAERARSSQPAAPSTRAPDQKPRARHSDTRAAESTAGAAARPKSAKRSKVASGSRARRPRSRRPRR
jgi:hypothetical protein